MRTTKTFRPVIGDKLEDRTVPSSLLSHLATLVTRLAPLSEGGLGGGGHVEGPSSSVLTQDAQTVRQALQSAEQTIIQDVRTVAAPSGGTVSATNFDAAVHTLLTNLNSTIATDLANLGGAGSATKTTVANALLTNTTNTNSLESLIVAAGAPASTSSRDVLRFDRELQTYFNQINSAVSKAILATPAPSTLVTPATTRTVNSAVKSTFSTLNTSISNAVTNDLLGTTVNSTQFKSDLSAALGTLTSTLTSATGPLSSLPAALQSTLLAASSTFSTDLAALTTNATGVAVPTTATKVAIRTLRTQLSRVIERAEDTLLRDIQNAVQAYNNNAWLTS